MTEHDFHVVFLVVHLAGVALGAGGATLTDCLFVSCVRRRHVGHTLEYVMRVSSSVVLAGYGLLLVSGVGLIATGSHPSQRFAAKMVMVGVLGVNGFFAHLVTFPHLSAKMRSRSTEVTLGFVHQIAGTAAISAVSWWGAIIAGTWKSSTWPFGLWIGVYLGAVLGAVVLALVATPHLLHLEHPEFDDAWPTLGGQVQRAALVPRHRLRQIDLS